MDFPDDTDRPPWGVHVAVVAGTLLAGLFSLTTTGLQLAGDTSLRCDPDGSEGTRLAPASPRARLVCGDDPFAVAARPAVWWTLACVTAVLGLLTLVTWFATHRHRVLGTMCWRSSSFRESCWSASGCCPGTAPRRSRHEATLPPANGGGTTTSSSPRRTSRGAAR